MSILESKINTHSPEFLANREAMEAVVADLRGNHVKYTSSETR